MRFAPARPLPLFVVGPSGVDSEGDLSRHSRPLAP